MNLDRRLLQQALNHWILVLAAVGLCLAAGLLIIGQASLLTRAVDGVFLSRQSLGELSAVLAALLAAMLLRGLVHWAGEMASGALSHRVRNSLREKLLRHLVESGPAFTAGEQSGELAAVIVEGVDALDAYFSQYLPGLLTALIIPLTILCVVLPLDGLTGLIFLLTAPLIPFFMLLIGSTAQAMTRKQWQSLARLKAYFLDVLQGLATLKSLGRSQSQVQVIAAAGDKYRRITMGVLRVAFTSALSLELLATLSTAVIAVQIGLRLLHGGLSFSQAFFILLLAPEFYQPLRQLGTRFHSGMAGAAASLRIFELFDSVPQQPVGYQSRQLEGDTAAQTLAACPQALPSFHEIRLEDVHVDYEEGRPALRGVTFSLFHGETLALVGPTGAGKSTIASLLLRFLSPSRGTAMVDGTALQEIPLHYWRSQLAWVPQKPYLFPGTVLENLRLPRPSASMEQVIQAARSAHAHDFIQALPQGYHTWIGEAGTPLSAGQLQRLALARAFLRDAPLLILDEVTASLDVGHEALLQDSLASLLQGRTALIIAHRLNTIASASRIVVLDAGRVVQSGDHASLLQRGGLYRSMVEVALHPSIDQPAHSRQPVFQPALPQALDLVSRELQPAHPPAASDLPLKPYSKRILRWLLSWILPYAGPLVLAVLAGFAAVASSMALLGASAYIVSAAALSPSIAALQVAIVSVRFFGLARAVFRYLERLLSHQVTLQLLSSLRVTMFRALEPLAPARLLQFHSGDLLARLIGDIESLEGFYVRGLAPPLVAVLVGMAGLIFLGRFSSLLALIFLAGLIFAGLGLPFLAHRLAGHAPTRAVAGRSEVSAFLVSLLQGLPELALFNQAEAQLSRLFERIQGLERAQLRIARVNAIQASLSGLLANLCLWSLLVAAIPLVSIGQLPGVYLATVLLAVFASFEAVASLPQSAGHLRGDLASAARLSELVDTKPQVVDPPAPLPAPAQPLLQVDGLSFRYPAASRLQQGESALSSAECPWILEDISFSLPPGKRLALVGPSGSGKSTLVSLLLRFWDYNLGRIRLGDRDLREYSQDMVRSQLAVLMQNPYLFSASLLDNLLLASSSGAQVTDEQVASAVQAACLDSFIAGLPQGSSTWVGEQGVLMSAGERQRLAIARTLLSKAPLLVLDEPTAHLDSLTEQTVMRSLLDRSAGRGLLLITHRLVGMEAMDEILVLSGGRIVERGLHSELLNCAGLYRRMWDLQCQQLPG